MKPSDILVEKMEATGLTNSQLAEKIEVTAETVRLWKSGSPISDKNAYRLADMFDLEANDFLDSNDKIDTNTLAGRIRHMRGSNYMDIGDLENSTGISRSLLSRIENGKSLSIKMETVELLCKFLGFDKEYLMAVVPRLAKSKPQSTMDKNNAGTQNIGSLSNLEKVIQWKTKGLISDNEFTALKAKIIKEI